MGEYFLFGLTSIALIILYAPGCSPALDPVLITAPGAASTTSGPSPGVPNPGSGGGTAGLTGTAALDAEEQSFLSLINTYRQQSGAPALQISVALTQASDWMATDMATKNYFDHTDSLGRDPFARMAVFLYTSATSMGENIAAGNALAQDTFTQWRNSPGHNANMIEPSYRAIGIARAYNANSGYGWYWVTDFGNSTTN